MKLLLGADHGGFELKEALKTELDALGVAFEDIGVRNGERCDYPDIALALARRVADGEADRGVLVCGTGIGVSIAANKVFGIRAALAHDAFTAQYAAAHNNANVLCLGGRVTGVEVARQCLRVWIATPFEGGRHQQRLDMIHAAETAAPRG